ncbi:13546_t:CDS:2, partial [Dentiscutata erythropus]
MAVLDYAITIKLFSYLLHALGNIRIGSISSTIADVTALKRQNQLYDNKYFLVDLAASVISFLVSTFGLLVTCCAKSSNIIRIYAVLFALLVILQIAHIVYICFFVASYQGTYISTCIDALKSNGNSTDSSNCSSEFRTFAAPWIISYALGTIISIYFAFVINSYATYCKNRDKVTPKRARLIRIYSILFSTIVAIAVLLDICGTVAIVLFFNHDVITWVLANAVDIIISIHFALVINAYTATEHGSKENKDNNLDMNNDE